MSGDTLLSVENVTQRFGGLVANSEVNVAVKRGEILGLIGPNGAGKSTLFNIIAGAFPPSEGRILFEGDDITRLSAPKRCQLGIARTFQVPKSFDTMTVIQNVIVGSFVRHPSGAGARRAALDVLDFAARRRRRAS